MPPEVYPADPLDPPLRRHLLALERWLELRLRLEIAEEQRRRAARDGASVGGPERAEELAGGSDALAEAERQIHAARVAAEPLVPPLERVVERFELDPLEAQILLLALAPELDLRFARWLAWLNDDVRQPWPTVDQAARWIAPDEEGRWTVRARLTPAGRLLRGGLLRWTDEEQALPAPARPLRLDERVSGFLLGLPGPNARLLPLLEPPPEPDLPGQEAELGLHARALEAGSGAAPLLVILGPPGGGHRAAAAALAARLERPLLALRGRGLPRGEAAEPVLEAVALEARLTGVLVVWTELDEMLDPTPGAEVGARRWWEALAHAKHPTVLLAERWSGAAVRLARPCLVWRLPEPDPAARVDRWRRELPHLEPALTQDLAARYRLSLGQITDAAAMARARGEPGHLPGRSEIEAACRAQSAPRLQGLAVRVEPTHTWDDLVLPAATLGQLRRVAAAVRHRERLCSDWGFHRHFLGAAGVVALFSGPSGTGKTLAASVIAAELGQPMLKIDLSSVVSKYIGETEKNLERIFSEAERAQAVLLFDEADALFGKRSQVSDARDRYANLEVAYLLQRTESYGGLVILTSNLRKNLDEAFLRRIAYAVDFPEPGDTERLRLWLQMIPPEAPVEGTLDLAELAKRYKLTGGSIRNAAVVAATCAAAEGRGVRMEDLGGAIGGELGKAGKLSPS